MKDVLLIIVKILNAGIDYDLTVGNKQSALDKMKARNKILDKANKLD